MTDRIGIREVARAAGVSVALASMALNGKSGVSEATRGRVVAVAESLGYRADPAARALRSGRTDSYGLVVRNLRNPFFLDVISGLQQAAADDGASVLVMDADYSYERELDCVVQLAARRVGGLAIAPVGPGESVLRWMRLCPRKPTVVLNAVCGQLPGASRVMPDNAAAVEHAVSHLVSLGHHRIAFLTAPAEVMADHDRLDTYLRQCDRYGLHYDPVETPLTFDAVHRATGRLLGRAKPPTAIVTNSDFTAHAVYAACRAAGARVGEDVSVVGHDDLPTSALLDPPLTTLSLDRRSLGRQLYLRLADPSVLTDHVEPVELVARASTAPAPADD